MQLISPATPQAAQALAEELGARARFIAGGTVVQQEWTGMTRHAQGDDSPGAAVLRQQRAARQSAGHDGGQHGPQAPQQGAQAGTGRQLPHVRHHRGHDQQRGRLHGRHDEAERAHGHGRQAQSHYALDEACGDEAGADGQQECDIHVLI